MLLIVKLMVCVCVCPRAEMVEIEEAVKTAEAHAAAVQDDVIKKRGAAPHPVRVCMFVLSLLCVCLLLWLCMRDCLFISRHPCLCECVCRLLWRRPPPALPLTC